MSRGRLFARVCLDEEGLFITFVGCVLDAVFGFDGGERP
jgi:hypothetical protein